ncbi:alpha/beta fold hydrolase [Uliginosibacterium gangwonense]|uniref:alpha/beta fold hydrolase n=1 Tax=Uliginosibacterium gangwonense TaxID=392736 RepID=UPI0003801311|nr:alpha/beta hydrolase [Uliginosibacterium gangwonense]
MLRSGLFAILICCLAGLYPLAGQAQDLPTTGASTPQCNYCREKLHTLAALRQSLPSQWLLQMEHEPIFNGEVLTLEAGQNHPQTVLLVHGLGQNGLTDWADIIGPLAQRYHVLSLDLPGFGYSSTPAGKYSPTNYARVLSWLLTRRAHGPAIVVGHSMGGAVALRFAATYPAQISKLVLVDAAGILQRTSFVKHTVTGRLNGEGMPDFLRGLLAHARDASDTALEKVFGMPDPTALLNASDDVWSTVLGSRSNANAAMALAEEDFTQAIYTLRLPTQIIWGEEDPIAPLRTGQMLARRLSLAQLQTLPGVGHVPMEAGNRDAFMRQLNLALELPPFPAPPPPPLGTGKPDLQCNGETGTHYSGQFREIRLNGCTAVQLRDLQAERIVIRDSIVQMLNVQVTSDKVAIDISNSELIATASEISGQTAIHADKVRMDLAGVQLNARGEAIEVERSSYFVASACSVRSSTYSGYWQGSRTVAESTLQP